jgi:hypothetical protein
MTSLFVLAAGFLCVMMAGVVAGLTVDAIRRLTGARRSRSSASGLI